MDRSSEEEEERDNRETKRRVGPGTERVNSAGRTEQETSASETEQKVSPAAETEQYNLGSGSEEVAMWTLIGPGGFEFKYESLEDIVGSPPFINLQPET